MVSGDQGAVGNLFNVGPAHAKKGLGRVLKCAGILLPVHAQPVGGGDVPVQFELQPDEARLRFAM